MNVQALRERRNALAKETRDLLNNNPGDKWNAECQAKYDDFMAKIESVDAEIKREIDADERLGLEVAAERTAKVTQDASGRKVDPRALFHKWLRGGDNALTANEWADIRATMSTTTNSEGGYTVPVEVSRQIVDSLKAFGGMRSVSNVIATEGFGDMNFPTSDGTSETGELIAQNTTATGADPTFGVVTITPYKYSSKIVAVPYELLQDTAVDMEGFIRQRLIERLGRITNTHFTTGTGSGQPRGVVTGASSGKVGANGQTATVIADDLIDLVHSVDPAYRASGNCVFMMRDASMGIIRKLKDSQNRPIYIPGWDGLGRAMPDTLLGYRVVINQDVAAMAASAKSILFGDFSKYVIRDVMALSLFRFTDSAYTKLGQVGFLAWLRAGGNLLDSAAVKYYANSAT
jgi:HK97 family phage major capsid protein